MIVIFKHNNKTHVNFCQSEITSGSLKYYGFDILKIKQYEIQRYGILIAFIVQI